MGLAHIDNLKDEIDLGSTELRLVKTLTKMSWLRLMMTITNMLAIERLIVKMFIGKLVKPMHTANALLSPVCDQLPHIEGPEGCCLMFTV